MIWRNILALRLSNKGWELHFAHVATGKVLNLGQCACSSETPGDATRRYTSYMGISNIHYPVAYGENNIYYMLTDQFTPFDSIHFENGWIQWYYHYSIGGWNRKVEWS